MKKKQIIYIVILYSIIYIFISYIINAIIFSDKLYFTAFENQISTTKIVEIIQFKRKFELGSYFFIPIIYTFKFILVACIIFIGIKLFELDINFENCFKIVLLAELFPLISSITKTLYFYIYTPRNFEDIQIFNPLGLTALIKIDSIPKYLIYPFQLLNIFEVAYWIMLAYGIKTFGNIEFKKAFKVTTLSYGSGLIIWCIFIVFLQLQFS
jgi:hypothetical protein